MDSTKGVAASEALTVADLGVAREGSHFANGGDRLNACDLGAFLGIDGEFPGEQYEHLVTGFAEIAQGLLRGNRLILTANPVITE